MPFYLSLGFVSTYHNSDNLTPIERLQLLQRYNAGSEDDDLTLYLENHEYIESILKAIQKD